MQRSIITPKPKNEGGPSNKSFGLTVGGIFAAIGILRLLFSSRSGTVSEVFVGVGVALVVLALLAPRVLTLPNRAWMGLGHVMFVVINPVVMALLYLTTFVPMGLAMRLMGRDPIARSFDRDAGTYWIDRSGGPRSSMSRQF